MRISDWSSDVCSSDLCLQHGNDLGGVDERKASAEQIDAPAPGAGAGKLQVERLHSLLRKTRPDIAQRIIAGRLPLECRWSRDVGSAPGVREETVHLGGDIGVCSAGDSEIGGRDHAGPTGSAANDAANNAAAAILFHQKSLPTLVLVSAKIRFMISSALRIPYPTGMVRLVTVSTSPSAGVSFPGIPLRARLPASPT